MDLTLHIFTPGWCSTHPHLIYWYEFNSGAFLRAQLSEDVLHEAACSSLLVGKRLIYSKTRAIMLMQGAGSKQVACSIMDSNTQPTAWGPIKAWPMWTFWKSGNEEDVGGETETKHVEWCIFLYLHTFKPIKNCIQQKIYILYVD